MACTCSKGLANVAKGQGFVTTFEWEKRQRAFRLVICFVKPPKETLRVGQTNEGPRGNATVKQQSCFALGADVKPCTGAWWKFNYEFSPCLSCVNILYGVEDTRDPGDPWGEEDPLVTHAVRLRGAKHCI